MVKRVRLGISTVLSALLFGLTACTGTSPTNDTATADDDALSWSTSAPGNRAEIRYDDLQVRGTNLMLTATAKETVRRSDFDVVALTTAIQDELHRRGLLESAADYVLAVTVEKLQISPVITGAWLNYRTEDDFMRGEVSIVNDAKQPLHTYKVSAVVDRREPLGAADAGRLTGLYRAFAEEAVKGLRQ